MERETLLQYADAVIHLITALDLDGAVATAAPATWEQAGACLRSSQPAEQALGYRLVLTALLTTPGAAQELVTRLERALAGRL